MKKLLLIFAIVLPFCSLCQTITGRKFVTNNTNYPPVRPILIIIAGESNSAAQFGLNTGLPTVDTQAFANAIIYNNRTHSLQNLHVGVNNLLLHTGITDNSCHGFELETAIQATANTAQFHTPIYFVKAGQGGSTIGQWVKGSSPHYYDTLLSRVNTALGLIGGHPQIFLWWTQGINDACTTGGCLTTWQTNTTAFFAQLRSDLSSYTIPIIVPLFTEPSMNGVIYNPYYLNMAQTLQNVRVCDTYGATLANGNHWDSNGVSMVADLLIAQTLGMLSLY